MQTLFFVFDQQSTQSAFFLLGCIVASLIALVLLYVCFYILSHLLNGIVNTVSLCIFYTMIIRLYPESKTPNFSWFTLYWNTWKTFHRKCFYNIDGSTSSVKMLLKDNTRCEWYCWNKWYIEPRKL